VGRGSEPPLLDYFPHRTTNLRRDLPHHFRNHQMITRTQPERLSAALVNIEYAIDIKLVDLKESIVGSTSSLFIQGQLFGLVFGAQVIHQCLRDEHAINSCLKTILHDEATAAGRVDSLNNHAKRITKGRLSALSEVILAIRSELSD